MTTTPQTEAQRLAASISETLDSQDDSYLTCSVTKCLLQQAATELLRLDALRLELQTQLADYKDACTKAETRADQAEGRAKLLACAWIKATDAVPQESDGEVFVRFSDGSIGTGWATYWHGSSNDFARWTFPDTDEFRMVSGWAKNVPASTGMHWTENEPVRLPQARTGRVYLAGPMTGISELNFPAFNQEADRLRAEGLQVLNPADHGIVDGADWADYLRHDIAGLASCERIHLLRGWSKSKGANLEATIAKAMGMTVTYQVDAEMEHNNAPAVLEQELSALLTTSLPYMTPVGRARLGQDIAQLYSSVSAPAVAQGETVAWMVYGNYTRQPFGMLSSAEAYMRGLLKSDPDGGYHIRPLRYTTPAPAPAQERCSTCGYLTSEREHLGCLRRAVKDLDIATGGPYDAQEVGLTDETLDNLIEDLSEWSRHVVEDTAHQTLEAHVREVLEKNPIIAALRAKGQT